MQKMITTLLMAAAVGVAGCREEHIPLKLGDAQPMSHATQVGAAPMFAVSSTGNEAAAWVSAVNGGTDGRLVISVDGAHPVTIADTLGPIEPHGESPPKLAYGTDGSLNAIYVVARVVPGRRFPLSALRFVRSTNGGASWSAPVTVTDDSVFGSHNFHALHAGRDGTLYVSWLDGRTGQSAPFLSRSTDGGKTWTPNVRVSAGESCPCCRTALATASDGTLYMAWRDVSPESIRDIVVASSRDHGDTWSAPVRVHDDNWVFDACPHAGPSMQVDDRGVLHIAWWTGKDKAAGVYYAHSTDGAKTFSAPVPLGVADFSRASHVQLGLRDDRTVVVAWDDGTKATPVVVARVSTDGGATFSLTEPLSDPTRAATFPVLAVTAKGIAIAWTEDSPANAAAVAHAHPAKGDHSTMVGLAAVGQAQVMVRRGTMP